MARKPIYNEDVIERLPVCLRFDKNDEFYKEFVIPLKQTRELSGFIVKLLKTYYDQKDVAKAVDDVLEEESPFATMHESLEKLAELNMNNQMAINSMKGAVNAGKTVLNDVQGGVEAKPQYSSVVEGFEDTVGFEVSPQMEKALLENKSIADVIKEQNATEVVIEENTESNETDNESSAVNPLIEQRFKKIEDKLSTVDDMNAKIDLLLKAMSGGVSINANESNVEESSVVESTVETVENNIVAENEDATSDEVVVEPIVQIKPGVEYEPINNDVEVNLSAEEDLGVAEPTHISSAPMSVEEMMAEAMKMSQAKADEEAKAAPKVEEAKPKVPKAFKKLAGSI